MGRKGETFPGLDVLRGKKPRPPRDGEPHKSKRPPPRRERLTPEQIAKLPPSERRRLKLPAGVPVMTENGIVYRVAPRDLTPELIGEIVELMASGAPWTTCAGSLGVRANVAAEWESKGNDPGFADTVYHDLVRAVACAREAWLVSAHATIASGRKGWQGRAWLAERTHPGTFSAPKQRLEHSGPGGGGIRIVPSTIEIPAEVPDTHPREVAVSRAVANGTAIAAVGALPAVVNGNGVHVNGKNGSSSAPLIRRGAVELPEEDSDP